MRDTLQNIIRDNRVGYCLECGKCSAVCPITRWEKRNYTSPRLLAEKAMAGDIEGVQSDHLFWSCLTCKRCRELCVADVHFSEFVCRLRALARKDGHQGECSHGDAIRTWGRIMTNPTLSQRRIGWLDDDLKIAEDSEIVFFVGCLPYYDVMFHKLGFEGVKIAKAAVKILNGLGVAPKIMSNERCCGHDQLWQGDIQTFSKLAQENLRQLSATGAKQILTTCPECARTLKNDYPRHIGPLDMEVLHFTQFLTRPEIRTKMERLIDKSDMTVTYQDSCRLGRHLKVYEEPREVLAMMGCDLLEMPRVRQAGLCCGTSCWTACGQVSKNIQLERLKEARATGAEVLVTACLKCQIHLKCAQNDPDMAGEMNIDIRDIITLLAERLA